MESLPLPEERPSPSGALLGIAIVLALGTFVIFGTALQAVHLGAGMWVSDVFFFVGLPALLLRQAGFSPVRLVGLDGFSFRSASLGAAVGAANVFAWVVPLTWLSEQVFPKRLLEQSDQSVIFEHQTAVGLVLIISSVSLAAPVCEEFLFRGLLQGGLSKRLGAWPALGLTALVFAASHYRPALILPLFEIGLVLGLLRWRSGSIWAAVGAHAGNNVLETVQFFAGGAAPPREGDGALVAQGMLFGNVALVGLWALVRWRPKLLLSPRPAEAVRIEPKNSALLVRGGLAALVLSFAALVGLDFRGAQANLAEQLAWLPKLPDDATPKRQLARARLEEERKKLLAGESSFSKYLELRREQQRAEKPSEGTK